MKDMERDLFWLDLGPAAEYAGMPCAGTAAQGGDASPDGRLHGFDGAENGCGCGEPDKARPGCGCGRPEGKPPAAGPGKAQAGGGPGKPAPQPGQPGGEDLVIPEPPDIFPQL